MHRIRSGEPHDVQSKIEEHGKKDIPVQFYFGLIILSSLAVLCLSACSLDKTVGTEVIGTLNLPAALPAGSTYYVQVENDTYCAIAWTSGTCSPPTAFYKISGVFPGTYYIYAWLDEAPADGSPDYQKYYGGIGLIPPASPNAEVPDSGEVTFNITF